MEKIRKKLRMINYSTLLKYFLSYFLLLSALLLTLLAFGLYRLKLSPARVSAGIYGIYGISCFIGGMLAGKGLPNRRFFWGLLSGLLYFLVLALMSFLLHKGLETDTKTLTLILAACAGCGTVGGMVS